MPDLTSAEIAEIEHFCSALYQRLAIAADSDFVGYIDCFTDDIEWHRPGMVMRGTAEVAAFLAAEKNRTDGSTGPRHLTRHMYTTIVIDVVSATMAKGRAYAQIYRNSAFDGQLPAPIALPEMVVEYATEFRKESDGWKMSKHSAQVIFA